jgi:hypothetical protein
MKPDRALTAILIGIGVLIVLSLAVFFIRQRNVDYTAENTPAGVVHDYLLALDRGEYERAYELIAESAGRPDFSTFRRYFLQSRGYEQAPVSLGEVVEDGNTATVQVIFTRSSDPFGETYRDIQLATLERQGGQWLISSAPYPVWDFSWSPEANPTKPDPAN